jgi:uncharacterized repeat protein (TIGR01451 family)
MQLTKTVSTNTIRPFEALDYEIVYTNIGGAAAYNVVIEDFIPMYTMITQDSAESNNSLHAGTATVEYLVGGSYSNSGFDNVSHANRTNIQAVKWSLNTVVNVGQGGRVRFSVIVK